LGQGQKCDEVMVNWLMGSKPETVPVLE
jgi:hypothetical protein